MAFSNQSWFNKIILKVLIIINYRKVRIKSSHCDPYKLGYTRATIETITESYTSLIFS